MVLSSMRFDDPRITFVTTHKEDYTLVAPPKLVEHINDIRDLAQFELVDISPSLPLFRYLFEGNPQIQKIVFPKRRYLGTIAAITTWLIQHESFAVLPSYFVAPYLERKQLSPLFPDLEIEHDHFRLFWKKQHWANTHHHTLAQHIREHPLQ